MPSTMTEQLGLGDNTCDVSLSELELVPAASVHGYPDLTSGVEWICVDRAFLRSFVGTCVLMFGSLIMVLASLHGPAEQQDRAGTQAAVASSTIVEQPTEQHAAVAAEPNTQDSLLKRSAPRAQRKVRRIAAKAPAKVRLASRPTKLRRRPLAAR